MTDPTWHNSPHELLLPHTLAIVLDRLCPLNPCAVAEFTLRHFPACALLRRHPVPPPRQFEPLLRVAAAVGASIDPSTSKVCTEQGRDTHLPTA